MANIDPDEINPFRAPEAAIGSPPVLDATTDDEATRRAHIGREASIRSLGALCYLLAACGLLATAASLFVLSAALQGAGPNQDRSVGVAARAAGVMMAITGASWAVGSGLRRLRPWARWTTIALMSLSVLRNLRMSLRLAEVLPGASLVVLAGALIPGLILYLVASPKGRRVFSPEYREVIRRTPHVRLRTAPFAKVLLALLVAVLSILVLMALYGGAG